jgi:von Willebrand factor type A domain
MQLCIIFIAYALASEPSLVFLLDMSGSMQGEEQHMVDGVNTLIDSMYVKCKETYNCDNIPVIMYGFSTFKTLILESVLHRQPHLTLSNYIANGGTSLFDTISYTLKTLPDNSTVIIATDGEDTASRYVSEQQVTEQIAQAQSSRGIEFIYIAKGPDAFSGGQDLGFVSNPVPTNMKMGDYMFAAPVMTACVNAIFRSLEPHRDSSTQTLELKLENDIPGNASFIK